MECWCISEIRTKTHCISSVDREKSMELWIANDHFTFIVKYFSIDDNNHSFRQKRNFFRVCHAERVHFSINFFTPQFNEKRNKNQKYRNSTAVNCDVKQRSKGIKIIQRPKLFLWDLYKSNQKKKRINEKKTIQKCKWKWKKAECMCSVSVVASLYSDVYSRIVLYKCVDIDGGYL